MRNTRLFVLSIVLTCLSLSVWSCNNNDDDDDPSKEELLYDKWWYNLENQGQGEHLFGSDGSVHIVNPGPGVGTYTWGPNDSMYISLPGGTSFTLWFRKIEEGYMEYWHPAEPLGYYYKFSTTKPQ